MINNHKKLAFKRSRVMLFFVISLFSSMVLGTEVIQVNFANSCSKDAQPAFNRAVTLLHSFEYPETTKIFNQFIEKNPNCAMAYWGAAMSIWHPLWAPPSRAELETGSALLAKTDQLQKSPREESYINSLKAFYSSTDTATHRGRTAAYEKSMEGVYNDYYESDSEATLFYALALLASADPHDKSYKHQYKAAGLLNWVRTTLPTHPGILHYLIHAYDYPGLAHLALDAALTYAEAAPDSAHAQHMPSHIFTRLGLWENSLASNHDSTKSAAHYTERAKLPGHYDEGIHSMDYLMYATLQTERYEEARRLLARLANIKRTDTENFKVAYTYAASPARYVLERRAWKEASELQLLRQGFDWQNFGWALSIHHFARGLGAVRSGRREQAEKEVATIKSLQVKLPAGTPAYWVEEVQVHLDVLNSWLLFTSGKQTQGLKLARDAANREDAVDKHPVTPGEVLPARELYADMLLESGEFEESLNQFQWVLEGSPNRLNALKGAAKAARRLGKRVLIEKYSSQIAKQSHLHDR